MAGGGQRHLEETITAAFEILTSIDHELSNPALWSSSSQHQQQQRDPTLAAGSDSGSASGTAGSGGQGAGPGHAVSLDEARHRYKTTVAALRASITTMSCCAQIGPTDDKDTSEIKRLDDHASVLRKEIESKNKDVKCLVDHLRNLISDLSMWQSSSISWQV